MKNEYLTIFALFLFCWKKKKLHTTNSNIPSLGNACVMPIFGFFVVVVVVDSDAISRNELCSMHQMNFTRSK